MRSVRARSRRGSKPVEYSINTLAHEPAAPFGGFKQSGIGREYGTFGLEAFMEPKSLLGVN